jgi:gamma-glutamyltranspeptidase / glutathione hydrolase
VSSNCDRPDAVSVGDLAGTSRETPSVCLDPLEWDSALRSVAAMAADTTRAPRRAAHGEHRVVVTGHPLSTVAALMTLRRGGSAADAFVTATALDCVLVPGTSSLAGTLRLLAHSGATEETWALNAGLNAPLAETGDYDQAQHSKTGRAVLVPGLVAGLEALWKRFGHLPWAALWEPAAHYASEGFPLDLSYVANMARRADVLARHPEGRAIFFTDGGRLPTRGSLLRQPALAATIAGIQAGGARYLYTGPWAHHLVETVQSAGGRLELSDLARYEPSWQPALARPYLDFEVRTTHPPHSGGAHILAALVLSEALGLHEQPSRLESGLTLYREIRAATAALSESAFDLDPADATALELSAYEHALGAEWARARADEIRSATGPASSSPPPQGSQNVIVRDDGGNVVVGIHTILSDSWGDAGLIVGGIALNSSGHRLLLRPPRRGGRITEPGSVFLTMRDGQPVLASGAHNKAGHQAEFQNLVNVLGRDMTIEDSVSSPRFGFFTGDHPLPWRPEYAEARAVDVEEFPTAVLEQLAQLGQPWHRRGAGTTIDVGFWYGIDLRAGRRSGVADHRRLGLALAE